jgi:hypothetical protein
MGGICLDRMIFTQPHQARPPILPIFHGPAEGGAVVRNEFRPTLALAAPGEGTADIRVLEAWLPRVRPHGQHEIPPHIWVAQKG